MGTSQSRNKNDMAICFVFFNPTKSKRLLMNYLYTRNIFLLQKLPTYTIELVYVGNTPEIHDAYTVYAKSIMFHKENLCRILETKIPKQYTKLAFLDSDIYFEDKDWYKKVSILLDTHDVVQPFSVCNWMDLTYKKILLSRRTVLEMQSEKWDYTYHPGFAWCMRRDWYKKTGFFDLAVSGSGDTLSCIHWLNKTIPVKFQSLPPALKTAYAEYCKKPRPHITNLPGTINHLYHGSKENRQYVDRHKLLHIESEITTQLYKNPYGVYEWVSESWNPMFMTYFSQRMDDDLSESPVKKSTECS